MLSTERRSAGEATAPRDAVVTHVALVVFEGVDLLDVGGPYEVLLTANRLVVRDGGRPPFEVLTVSADPDAVTAYGGLRLVPTGLLDDVDGVDVLLVPGTVDVSAAVSDARLLEALRRAAVSAGIVASVCTGAFLLAHAGLLRDVAATTHHEDLDELAALLGPGSVYAAPWVDAGHVVTAGGLSSGIAMALHLVDRLHSRGLAHRTARQLADRWDPDAGPTVPSSAETPLRSR